ncbi:MAG: hypothetical protein HC927_00655 [Deltaproteobacteria bacterium]|nr:hypothetical protein [Deltaproteobacteria bacterium]
MRKWTLQLVVPASLLLAGCGDVDSGPAPDSADEPKLADESTFRTVTWMDFPIVLDGVTVAHMDPNGNPYQFEIEPNVFIDLEDFADVATRWSSFRPCDYAAPSPHENAKNSFFYYDTDVGANYITVAEAAGLHVIMPLPFGADISEPCNGIVVSSDELWNHGGRPRFRSAMMRRPKA